VPSTAASAPAAARVVRITHPFHPLHGQAFELVGRRLAWGEDRVHFYDAQGRLRLVPASWTDVGAADPFVVRAAGRCPFRARDLVELAARIAARRDPGA